MEEGQKGSSGFTLLEMIISLAVLSMVVLIIYYAFSMGVQVWNKQSQKKSLTERKEVLCRFLEEDFSDLTRYTMSWEKGEIFFFAGGKQALFYVTRNGLGSKERHGYSLFFSCLYIDELEDGTKALYIYKTPFPEKKLIDEVRSFQSQGEVSREIYSPPQAIRSQAILIYKGIESSQFSYSEKEFKPFSGNTNVFEDDQENGRKDGFAKKEWITDELPQQLQFQCSIGEELLFIHAEPDKKGQ